MSFLDRIAAAITPAVSDETRAEARREADAIASGERWFALILYQHRQIESLVAQARMESGPDARREAVHDLATVLTGHSMAEEAVLYPELPEHSGKTHAGMAYEEHAMTKVQFAKLEKLDPMSEAWAEKLDHIESALQQHMYQEEGTWLPDLAKNLPDYEKTLMTNRYIEEYERYCGKGTCRAASVAMEREVRA